jgi:hypothetical protein
LDIKDEAWEKKVPLVDGYGIAIPSYSYWNIAYALTLKGKLFLYDPGIIIIRILNPDKKINLSELI